jgi:hypothetical protein
MMGTLHEDHYTFFIHSRLFLLRMWNATGPPAWGWGEVLTTSLRKIKVNVYLPSLMMKVPDHLYV